MAGVALALLSAYGLLIFGVGYLDRRHRYGSTPMRLATLRGMALVVAALMAGGFGLLVAGPITSLAGLVPSPDRYGSVALGAAGIAVFVAGLVVVALAQRAMGASWRVGLDPSERTALVITGPFRWVRNPIYSALVIMAAGACLMVLNAVAVSAVAVLAAAVVLQVVLVEEPYLARTHGDAYEQYRHTTARFVPVLRPHGSVPAWVPDRP